MSRVPIPMQGSTFGKLLVLPSYRYVKDAKSGKSRIQWLCLCDPKLGGCGMTKWCYRDALINKRTKNKACQLCANKSHGMSNTPEYRAWVNMHQRCGNPNNSSWEDYGGRGIKVDEAWDTFEQFFKDMGKRPSPDHSLDKMNNYANYGPGNCLWATAQDQAINRRNN